MQGRENPHMQLEQSLENLRTLLEGLQRTALQARAPIEQEHQSGYQKRPQSEAAMFVLITSQISRPQTISQHHRLAESQAESLAGDGVDCTRRISDQSNISAAHALQLARGGERALLRGGNVSSIQPSTQFREPLQRFGQPQ